VRNEAGRTTPALANETSGPSKVSEPTASNSLAAREPDTIEIAGQTIPLRSLRVTVLDAQSDGPIPGAEATHTLMGFSGEGAALAPLRADSNGIVALRIPERVPGGERMGYFEVSAHAEGYAPRTIHWLSTTGSVLSVVSTQYTVHLDPGITLSGTVVDDTGHPIAGVRVGAIGNSYHGYTISTDSSGKLISPPEVRAEDFASFWLGS